MQKTKFNVEPVVNIIEHANATDKGRFFEENSLDIVFCDPPLYKNQNDKAINNWNSEQDYTQWFRIFVNIVSNKLKKTGVFYLIGEMEDLIPLISICNEFNFNISMIYYFPKFKKGTKNSNKVFKYIDSVVVLTRNFQREVKKILKLKQQQANISSREINLKLNNNGNGGGYWSLYCGENSKNVMPTEEHWNILKNLFKLELEYSDINTQFKPYDGINLWDDISNNDDKLFNGINRSSALYERLLKLNRKEPAELVVWDPFCGYGNSVLAMRDLNVNFYANEFDTNIYYKAMVNTGNTLKIGKPIVVQMPK